MNSLLAGGDSKGTNFCRRFIPLRTESGGDGEQMAQVSKRFQGKKFLLLVVLCAVVLLLIFTARRVFSPKADCDLSTLEGRTAYLQSLGWEIDPESESFRTVIVPDQLEGIMAQYNKLQLKQGYDLSRHLGESCLQYCYEVTNYPDSDGKVLVSLYLQDGEIIAADIHSTALNGFMHGLTKAEAE